MPLVPQSIPALYGGVSQQAAVSRSSTQCEEAVNCDFSIARGASKRPPLEILNQLTSTDLSDAFFTWTRLDNGEWYLIVVPGDGTFEAFNAKTGDQITATNDTGQSYLTTDGNASEDFFAVTLDDTVYIVNRTVQTVLDSDNTAGTIAGTAQSLQDDALDSALDGSIWEILGDERNPVDTYYAKKQNGAWFEWVKPGIQYKIQAATMPHIFTLVETANPGGADIDFTVAEWEDRLVGDTETNEAPSFLGFTIDSLFFKSDRLGIISGQNFTTSEVGEYGNFWRTTVTDVLDSDRIDHKVNAFEVTKLFYAENVSKSLVMFGDNRQFSIDGAPVFSPGSLNVNPITSFPASRYARPVSSGPNVFFASDAGDYTHIREMYIQDETLTLDAANVSAHAENYVPANIRAMEVHPQFDQILMTSPDEPGKVYSYQFHWSGSEKALSAWSRWEIAGDVSIVSMQAIESSIYAVYVFNGKTYIGHFNLKSGDSHDGITHKVHLDHLQKVTANYNGAEDRTYFSTVFPMALDDGEGDFEFSPFLVRGLGWDNPSSYEKPSGTFPWYIADDNQFYLPGDWTGDGDDEWYVGLGYDMRYRFSEQFYVENGRPQLHTRVQLRTMTIHFTDTGFFETHIKIRGHDWEQAEVVPQLTTDYTSRTVGDEYFQLNRPQLVDGTFQFPIFSRASDAIIEIVNPSPLPSSFQAAEWKALISKRTPR